MHRLQLGYMGLTRVLLRLPWLPVVILVPILVFAIPVFFESKQIFLPEMDEGEISIRLTGEAGLRLDETDEAVIRIENLLLAQSDVMTVFTSAGKKICLLSKNTGADTGICDTGILREQTNLFA